jgi:hypothetical protein
VCDTGNTNIRKCQEGTSSRILIGLLSNEFSLFSKRKVSLAGARQKGVGPGTGHNLIEAEQSFWSQVRFSFGGKLRPLGWFRPMARPGQAGSRQVEGGRSAARQDTRECRAVL